MARVLLGWLLMVNSALAAPVVDGEFTEWDDTNAALLNEPLGDAGPIVDLGKVWWRFDQQGLWLQIDTATPANIAQASRTLSLLIDHSGGGAHYRGSAGVDQVLEYSPPQKSGRFGYRTLTHQQGAWTASEQRPGYLRTAPTVSSARYEILARTPQLTAGTRVQVMAWNDDDQDASEWITLTPPVASQPLVLPQLSRLASTDIRVMVWNNGGERTTKQPQRFAALIEAVAPDVAMLDEVWPTQKTDFLKTLQHQSMGSSGGRQRGLILSRWPLQPAPAFRYLDYPPGTAQMIQEQGSDFMRRDLKNLHADGVAAHGALVEVSGRRMLLVALDLQCCGNGDDSPQDQLREIQARRIATAIDEVRSNEGFDHLLVGGDFNLVGSRRPLEILLNNQPPALSIAHALQPDGLSNVTWIRDKDVFPPGRLDYMLFSKGFTQLSGVVFNPGVMTSNQLHQFKLQRDTTDRMSGHQPLVIDFSWR